MNKTLLRQRKMADDLKKQAGMIMSRGNNQLDDQLCDADMSSNYPARKEEQERQDCFKNVKGQLSGFLSLISRCRCFNVSIIVFLMGENNLS